MKTTITKKLFGGEIDFIIYNTPKKTATKTIEETYKEALRLQKIFNFYDKESELSKLNLHRKKKVSEELLFVLQKALDFSKQTHGSYDVSLGKFILLRKQGKIVTPTCSYKDIQINENEITLTNQDVLIDLGSIAKGFIADCLAEFLKVKGVEEFFIDARGDICVKGKQTHILGIQHPRKEGDICQIKLKNEAVATSGDYKQFSENFEKSHIINQKEISSVTVIAPTLEKADAYATALFTCSEKDRTMILKLNKGIKCLIMEGDNKIKMYHNFEESVYEEQNENLN